MAVLATGQLTIIDYNDAPMMYAIINVNSTTTQGFNPDSGNFLPDWSVAGSHLKLETIINRSGVTNASGGFDNIVNSASMDSHSWYKWNQTLNSGAGNWELLTNNTDYVVAKDSLTIKTNMVNESAWEFKFVCRYTDPSTGLSVPVEARVSFAKVVNGTGIADAAITLPDGNVFRNAAPTDTLPIVVRLMKGSIIETDYGTTGNVHPDNYIAWFISDSHGTGDNNFGVGPTEGWRRLTSGISYNGATGESTLTLVNDLVIDTAIIMAVIKDPEHTGAAGTVLYYKDTASIIDMTDNVQTVLESSGGLVFKNGMGTSTLLAKVFQNAKEIDSLKTGGGQQLYTYKWFKRKRDGSLDNWYKDGEKDAQGNLVVEHPAGPNGFRAGKQISITGDNVDGTTTFVCEVEDGNP